jgi:hypothetical protein
MQVNAFRADTGVDQRDFLATSVLHRGCGARVEIENLQHRFLLTPPTSVSTAIRTTAAQLNEPAD